MAHKILSDNSVAIDAAIKSAMDAGNSYPTSASLAFQSIIQNDDVLDLTNPNNILGSKNTGYRNCQCSMI